MKKWLIPLFAFVLVLGSSLTCFASEVSYPAFPPEDAQYKTYYIIYKDGSSIYSYATNTSDIYYNSQYDEIYHNAVKGSIWIEKYQVTKDGKSWSKTSATTTNSSEKNIVLYNASSNLLYTNFNIKDESTGKVFFQSGRVTLAEKILQVGETEILVKMPEVLGTMKILTLCGVGCLALLISSPVLLKVLHRFL